MRRFLDALYRGAGWVAALSIFLIFALVAVQVSARILDVLLRLAGFVPIGFIVPSIAEICGFLLAIASFMALAHTLVVGGHIRVGILIDRLSPTVRRPVETLVGLLATALCIYAAIAVGRLAWKSWSFNDVSYGMIPVPLALPQGLMTLGLAILAVALLDVTVRAWREGSYLKGGEA
jgi:TRAP-type C4-dicarboxylate transport system permease small subunit